MCRILFAAVFSSILAFAQTRLEFEVASIKPAGDQIERVGAGVHIDGAQVSLIDFSARDVIALAYRVQPNQILGPDWMTSQRYNIAAKLPDGGSQDQVRQMIQSLLTDRFQMKMHREMRDFQVYGLSVSKTGLKMTALPPDPEFQDEGPEPINVAAGGNANAVMMNLGKRGSLMLGASSFEANQLGMGTFAELLSRFMDRQVVDMTNLKGRYAFTLELTPEDRTALLVRSAVSAGITLPPQALRALDFGTNASLINSMQKLGLALESRKAPLEVLVIDGILKTPAEN